ncbi:GntR family transcriptional regulator [Acetobacteraceae bacterium H6797]|nr:GntR family transcriptional regulator [Acetobacteraceae bacterium H6797]
MQDAPSLLLADPPDSRLPLHLRLRDQLAARLAAGEWPPGTALPAESKLAQDYGVSLQTMRRAINHLSNEGLVDRHHGRGTFTRSAAAAQGLLRFFRFAEAQGSNQAPGSRILAAERIPMPPEAARRLRREPGEPCLRLRRHRSWEGAVILDEVLHLPLPEVAPLLALAPEDYEALLYPMMQSRCGLLVSRAEDDISVGRASAEEAEALGLTEGEPVVIVERTAYELRGLPVETRRAVGRADRFRYRAVAT